MKRNILLTLLLTCFGISLGHAAVPMELLESGFLNPPKEAQSWTFWWWLNGAASKEGISRDFEEMRKKGIAGAILFDAGEVERTIQTGPPFMSDEWRELYKHALREAERCGIALSVNVCSGWNAGGPWITPDHAIKTLVSAQTLVEGSKHIDMILPQGKSTMGFYRDIAILAVSTSDPSVPGLHASSYFLPDYPPSLAMDNADKTRWVSFGDKAGMGPTPEKPEFLQFSYAYPRPLTGIYLKPGPECGPKEIEVQFSDDGKEFRPLKRTTLEQGKTTAISFDQVEAKYYRVLFLSSYPFQGSQSWNVQVNEISLLPANPLDKGLMVKSPVDSQRTFNLGEFVDKAGRLVWDAPPGRWNILRIGYTITGLNIVAVGSGPAGLELDPMSAEAMDLHFAETGAKLIADAGSLAGKTLQYLHIDSWEIRQPTWTPKMLEEFKQRRGYDPLPWLPALCGIPMENTEKTRRFIQDYRRTIADLVAENYYGRLAGLAVQGGLLGTHSEAGGGGSGHSWIDGLQCQSKNAVPMGEFWNRLYEPDGPITLYGANNPTVKRAAAAAHIYGKPICQAEAFTSLACEFTEYPWAMKDIVDSAFCDGLNRIVHCFWVHQPRPEAKPGIHWEHIGARFGHSLTWWPMSEGWLTYLSRCQFMLQQGLFVADFAYLQNEAIPAITAHRFAQQPMRPSGFDYDPMNAEVLLTRTIVKNNRLTLPDGMSYRYLVLPHEANAILSPTTLKKVNELAAAGVTVIGPAARLADIPKVRQGTLDAITRADGQMPDIEYKNQSPKARFDFIHRRDGETDIYFVSNQTTLDVIATVAFRVSSKTPELWDAVTGKIRALPAYKATEDGRTEVPMAFAPRQSWFIVFRKSNVPRPTSERQNFQELKPVQELTGAWTVQFDPAWFYPVSSQQLQSAVVFEKLEDWTQRSEAAIKHYSGIATYRTTFNYPEPRTLNPLFLNLGVVKNVARVRLNGKDLGTVWTAPWQVEITDVLKPGANTLEIEVANLWPNRLIGDGLLPEEQRRTVTNIRTYNPKSPTDTIGTVRWARGHCPQCKERLKSGGTPELLPSGLFGPVTLQSWGKREE